MKQMIIGVGTEGCRSVFRAVELDTNPERKIYMFIDADVEALSQIEEGLANIDGNHRIIRLGEKIPLRDMVHHEYKHRLVSSALKGISPSVIPRTIEKGSQKVFGFTYAAFLAQWAQPGGIYDQLNRAIRELQQLSSGDDPFLVLVVGLQCGGVGGIGSTLIGLAIRSIAANLAAFEERLELDLIFIEVHPDETDPRILGNAREALKLLEEAQRGNLKVRVPNIAGLEILESRGPTFDNVFFLSEVTGGRRLDNLEFRDLVAHFINLWASHPVAMEARSKLIDKLSILEEEIEGHPRFLQSVGIRGVFIHPRLLDFAVDFATRNLLKHILEPKKIDVGREVGEFIRNAGAYSEEIGRKLWTIPENPLLGDRILQEINAFLPSWLGDPTPLDVHVQDFLERLRLRLEKPLEMKRNELLSGIEELLWEKLREFGRRLELGTVLEFLKALEEDLKRQIGTPRYEMVRTSFKDLEARWRSPMGLIFKGRILRDASRKILDVAREAVRRQIKDEVQKLYVELSSHLEELRRRLEALRARLHEVRVQLDEESPSEFLRTSQNKAVQPILTQREFTELLSELLDSPLDPPKEELLLELAKEADFLEASNAKEFLQELKKAIEAKLSSIKDLDIPALIRWKERKGQKESLLRELSDILDLKRLEPLWSINPAELPSERPLLTISVAAIPDDRDLKEIFKEVDFLVHGNPKEIMVMQVQLGATISSLAFWKRLLKVPPPQDGKGPIVPEPLRIEETFEFLGT